MARQYGENEERAPCGVLHSAFRVLHSGPAVRIALVAMGGDSAPAAEVAGAVAAARAYELEVLLVGRPADLERELAKHPTKGLKLGIVEATETIDMHGSDPARAVRQKPDSS